MDSAFPPAPWHLRGWGIATVQPVELRAAQAFVPPDCDVVAVVPGKTLGGLLFLSYESGSTLVYRELNVVAALVRVGTRLAFYLRRLYVDSPASLAGGRRSGAYRRRRLPSTSRLAERSARSSSTAEAATSAA